MWTRIVRHLCVSTYILIVLGCTNATPEVSFLRPMDEFDFKKSFFTTSDLSGIPLEASCTKFIDHIDMSFDDGTTWNSVSAYDPSQPTNPCSNQLFQITLMSSKSPWSSMSIINGQTLKVKFRAQSRTGNYVYREISVKYTAGGTASQETLAGAHTSQDAGGLFVLRGKVRAQQQSISSSSSYIIRGRILQ